MENNYESKYRGKNIMITGGMGFIGSNLARRLVELNPKQIVVVDCLIKGHGGNIYNIKGIEDKVCMPDINHGGVDLRNSSKMSKLIQGIDYVFNLAGSVSHSGSKEDPLRDLELNLESHVSFLEVCRKYMEREKYKPNLKIIFAGTRDQYGKVREEDLPVNETQLTHKAADPQGINKSAAEFYHLWYRDFGIKSASLRMTNTYGPRHQMKDPGQGVLNWFIRKAINGEDLEIWGGGKPLRDFNHVDDVVDALLMTMASNKTDGQIYNLGSYLPKHYEFNEDCGNILSVADVAKKVTKLANTGSKCIFKEYPKDKAQLEPGHFYADISKIFNDIGWKPKISLDGGIKETIDFYRKNKSHYW